MSIQSAIEARIIKELAALGNEIAEKARRNAAFDQRIANSISVSDVKKVGGRYTVTIRVDMNEETGAPEALAFERGSGIHNPDNPNTYVIKPKEKPVLAFFWDQVDETSRTGKKFRGISPTTGKALFTYVDHPGVAARPFLQPAIDSTKPTIPLKLLGAVKNGYKTAVVKEWRA